MRKLTTPKLTPTPVRVRHNRKAEEAKKVEPIPRYTVEKPIVYVDDTEEFFGSGDM